MNIRLSCLLAALALSAPAHAQPVVAPGPLPTVGHSPMLFVRVSAPEGVDATFYQGRSRARNFPAPVVVGLRPGYCYRFRLTRLPGLPGVPLFPSVEVHGSLKLPPRCGAASFPALLNLTQDDIDAAVGGALVTKVIYLEHPDNADPRTPRPGELLETDYPVGTDLEKEARLRGRVMLVVHLGGRTPTEEELIKQNVAGTILFPGEKALSPASGPPCIRANGPGFYDPYHGPRPLEEECLHDGGDRLGKVGFDAQGQIGGLDPEDTVAEYRESGGRRRLSCSNRVCLCVPRFAAVRMEVPLARAENVFGPADRRLVQRERNYEGSKRLTEWSQMKGPLKVEGRSRPAVEVGKEGTVELIGLKVIQAIEINLGVAELIGTKKALQLTEVQKAKLVKQLELAREFTGVKRPAAHEQVIGTGIIGRVEAGPEIVSASVAPFDLTSCCHEEAIHLGKPLVLIKCADRSEAQVGDEVTFTLRYSNTGGRPITDVAVSDSLSGRLEYVPGSAASDRDAVLTIQPNEAGSVILRWEISGTLLPGQTGRLRFKAKVR